MKILICGLPGSGKTTLARELSYHFNLPHHNADIYREYHRDWDFSWVGRQRQAMRMYKQFGILDFVCPTEYLRTLVDPSFIIWMDTVDFCDYDDTNEIWEPPSAYNVRIMSHIDLIELRDLLQDYPRTVKGAISFLHDILKVYKY